MSTIKTIDDCIRKSDETGLPIRDIAKAYCIPICRESCPGKDIEKMDPEKIMEYMKQFDPDLEGRRYDYPLIDPNEKSAAYEALRKEGIKDLRSIFDLQPDDLDDLLENTTDLDSIKKIWAIAGIRGWLEKSASKIAIKMMNSNNIPLLIVAYKLTSGPSDVATRKQIVRKICSLGLVEV
jgi:hypothetical protein